MKKVSTLKEQINEEMQAETTLFEEWGGARDESGNLLEGEQDWINGDEFGNLPDDRKAMAAMTLQNIKEDIEDRCPWLLAESNTTTISNHDAILLPTWRLALPRIDAMDLVGTIVMPGPSMNLYIERIGYVGKMSQDNTSFITKTKRTSVDDPQGYNLKVYYIDHTTNKMTDYNAVTLFDGTGTKGHFENEDAVKVIGYVVHKEYDDTGDKFYTKLLVKVKEGEVLTDGGSNVQIDGLTGNIMPVTVEAGEFAIDFLLETYNGPITTSEGETLSDFNTFQITLEQVNVTAGMHAVGFEYTTALVQDMNKQFGVNARKRLAQACHYQLATSISKRLFNLLCSSAEVVSSWVYASAPGRHPQEKYAALMDKIRYERSRIGSKTHTAIANKLVGTLGVASIISGRDGFREIGKSTGGAGLMKIGSIGGMDCYQVTFVNPGVEFVLLTLKQNGNQQAAGAYYCPYIGITLAGSGQEGIADFTNGMRSRVYFVERSALLKNPFDASRYSTFFSVNLTGSSVL